MVDIASFVKAIKNDECPLVLQKHKFLPADHVSNTLEVSRSFIARDYTYSQCNRMCNLIRYLIVMVMLYSSVMPVTRNKKKEENIS